MFKSKLSIVIAVIVFVLGLANLDGAIAGEKRQIKSHGASYTTTVNQIEVGDEEGHIILIFENATVFFDEARGEKFTDRGVGFMDINPNKPAEMYMTGYGVHTNKDGDKMTRSYKGKPVAKDQWKGVFTITGGTGKYEGVSGSGTWTSNRLTPKQSYVEVEGEMEMP
jgi:hypothetical protein